MRVIPIHRRTHRRRAPVAVASALALLGGASAAAYLFRRRRQATTDHQAENGHREFRCACGQEFRVSGTGRHRVFWLPDAGRDDPVLDDRCPACERTLSLQD